MCLQLTEDFFFTDTSYIRSGDLKWHFFCPFSLQLGVDSSNEDNTKMLSLLVVDCKDRDGTYVRLNCHLKTFQFKNAAWEIQLW
ncbi:hypothetical protein ISN44_As13g018260 [Arabidopsis suecica]|uniref:Uncharacterized protein n=1 Tax=Arabidopsis suecica TaxID=45249 RepID=A0A8T1XZM2_ARASU|nr:hypothetical protein ISN44_As13g018260 [Arabidopsis suecica]KAG7537997.1 hypothetical protein ISN44_As13g018260 [Arabidopsis suecica]